MAYFWYFLGYGFLGYLLEKLFAALTHAEHRRAGRAFCSRPSAPCTVLQCAPCSRWARIASARFGSSRCSAASPQRRRNTPFIFSATPCSACASGTTARQKRTSTAVSVCVLARVGRARCARRAPRAARAGGSRRRHSVRRDEHRAALPRHRRAVEHRRAAALGRH